MWGKNQLKWTATCRLFGKICLLKSRVRDDDIPGFDLRRRGGSRHYRWNVLRKKNWAVGCRGERSLLKAAPGWISAVAVYLWQLIATSNITACRILLMPASPPPTRICSNVTWKRNVPFKSTLLNGSVEGSPSAGLADAIWWLSILRRNL